MYLVSCTFGSNAKALQNIHKGLGNHASQKVIGYTMSIKMNDAGNVIPSMDIMQDQMHFKHLNSQKITVSTGAPTYTRFNGYADIKKQYDDLVAAKKVSTWLEVDENKNYFDW